MIDPYAWLTDPKDPEVIAYLEAENAYMEAPTAGLGELRSELFDEIKARTQETDLSVPVRKGNWWRYARTVEGQQYAIHCRRRVRDGEITPPIREDGKPLDGEEVLLDGNELAAGAAFFSLGALVGQPGRAAGWPTPPTSPATSGSPCGSRTWPPARCLPTRCRTPTTAPPGRATAPTLFYVTVDDAWRPYRVWRHAVGTPVGRGRGGLRGGRRTVLAGRRAHPLRAVRRDQHHVKLTSEVGLLDAGRPGGPFAVVAPRR